MGNLYGLIGYPVAHSLSPIMHNQTFQSLGMDHFYHKFLIHPSELENAVFSLRTLGISGFNVTIPHKVNVMKYLDEIDDLARDIGAVNTVAVREGKLIGYNTDGAGFVMSLKKHLTGDLTGKKVLVVGAGGASRAIYKTLVQEGIAKIDIANRTMEKANEIIGSHTKEYSEAITLHDATVNLGEYDIVVNTTSIGMSPKIEEYPISLENMKEGTLLSDIIYNPMETTWLQQGSAKGAITSNGVGMFIGQGALAFEMWTGVKPDFSFMEKVVTEQLGGS